MSTQNLFAIFLICKTNKIKEENVSLPHDSICNSSDASSSLGNWGCHLHERTLELCIHSCWLLHSVNDPCISSRHPV